MNLVVFIFFIKHTNKKEIKKGCEKIMGRILGDNGNLNGSMELTQKIINKQYDRVVNSQYTRFLKNAPIPVTYYHQNVIESTTDVGFENVNTNIGVSGKKYNKIKNIPIYGIDKSSFSLDDSEIGIKGEYHSEGNLPLSVIKPIPEDYFLIELTENDKYLFKITNVEIDNISSNNYYKIDFKFDREYDPIIEKQVVGEFTCIFDYIGSDSKCILKDDELDTLQKLTNIYIDIMNAYYDQFFDPLCCCFIYHDQYRDKFIYDPYVTEFIIRNQLFINNSSFNSYVFSQMIELPKDFLKRYKQTIFCNFLEKHSFESRVRELRIQDRISYFYKSGKRYYVNELYTKGDALPLYNQRENEFDYDYNGDDIVFNTILKFLKIDNSNIKEEEYEFEEPVYNDSCELNSELLFNSDRLGLDSELDLDIPYGKELNLDSEILLRIPKIKLPAFLILKKVQNYEPDKPNKKETLEEYIIDNFSDFYCENNRDYFTCIPIILFIIKSIMNNITIKNIK